MNKKVLYTFTYSIAVVSIGFLGWKSHPIQEKSLKNKVTTNRVQTIEKQESKVTVNLNSHIYQQSAGSLKRNSDLPNEKFVDSYDNQHNIISRLVYYEGEAKPHRAFTYSYNYDKAKRIVNRLVYQVISLSDNNKSIQSKALVNYEVYQYDSKGLLTKVSNFLEDRKTLEDYSSYIYNDKGDLVMKRLYNGRGEFISEDRFLVQAQSEIGPVSHSNRRRVS